jgi:hypothetical protein
LVARDGAPRYGDAVPEGVLDGVELGDVGGAVTCGATTKIVIAEPDGRAVPTGGLVW